MGTIGDLVGDSQVAAVICNQFGDTGKGKISDYLAMHWADVIARGTGGNNAGHTVVINGKKRVFHLLPAGIIYDKDGKTNILGNGMVLDLKVLGEELDELEKENISYNHLEISEDAFVIMPYHIKRDKAKNTSQKESGIGSTGRGIGPCYEDKISRRGIRVMDLFDKDKLAKKIEKAAERYPEQFINIEKIVEELIHLSKRIEQHVTDTKSTLNNKMAKGSKILLEGAQGLLLSIEYGTYPGVTSSDPSLNGTAAGVGLSAKVVDLPLGIVKFPYMTRVGAGPLPSEFGGRESENYCEKGLEHDIKYELTMKGISFKETSNGIKYDHHDPEIIKLMNSNDPFTKGLGIRLSGEEYGATTGRPRRTGWTDLEALSYAININGPNVVLTKIDVLQGAEEFKLVTGYDHNGTTKGFTTNSDKLYTYQTELETFPAFPHDISKIENVKDLPEGVSRGMKLLEERTGANIRMVSVGADQNETIII